MTLPKLIYKNHYSVSANRLLRHWRLIALSLTANSSLTGAWLLPHWRPAAPLPPKTHSPACLLPPRFKDNPDNLLLCRATTGEYPPSEASAKGGSMRGAFLKARPGCGPRNIPVVYVVLKKRTRHGRMRMRALPVPRLPFSYAKSQLQNTPLLPCVSASLR